MKNLDEYYNSVSYLDAPENWWDENNPESWYGDDDDDDDFEIQAGDGLSLDFLFQLEDEYPVLAGKPDENE